LQAFNFIHFLAEHWRLGIVPAMVAVGAAQFTATHPRQSDLPGGILDRHPVCHRRSDVCRTRANRLRHIDDLDQRSSLRSVHRLAQQAEMVHPYDG
jgi:hypothetical protein